MPGGNLGILPLLFSALALIISIYGVVERRNAAWRLERQRLATIIADLDALHFEQLKSPNGLEAGDFTDSINGQRELLAAQALAALPKFRKETTSSELRVLAHALSRAGYPGDSERIWQMAISKAATEGITQTLYARRGYAYHLFAAGRTDDARAAMRTAVESLADDDDALVKAIETLRFWAIDEVASSPDGSEAAEELLEEARRLNGRVRSPRIRARMHRFLELPDAGPSMSLGRRGDGA